MKRITALIVGVFSVGSVWASDCTYNDYLKNGSVVADATYVLDCTSKNIDYLSVQAIYTATVYGEIAGSTSTINATTDTIVSTDAFTTGLAVVFSSTTLTGVNLVNNTTYYVMPYATGYIQLATTKANAITGIPINITATGTQGTFKLTPALIQNGSPFSFRWQASNDGTNYYDLSVTSITVTAGNDTNYIWDFSKVNYGYVRCKLIAGNFGAVLLKLFGVGDKVAP